MDEERAGKRERGEDEWGSDAHDAQQAHTRDPPLLSRTPPPLKMMMTRAHQRIVTRTNTKPSSSPIPKARTGREGLGERRPHRVGGGVRVGVDLGDLGRDLHVDDSLPFPERG